MLKDFIRSARAYPANKHLANAVTLIDAQAAAIYTPIFAMSEHCTVAFDDKNIFYTYDLSLFDAGYLRFTLPWSEHDQDSLLAERDDILRHLYLVINVVQSVLVLEAVNGDEEVIARLNGMPDEFDGLMRAISPRESNILDAYYRLGNPAPTPTTYEVTLDRETGIVRAGKAEGQFPLWVSFVHTPKSKSSAVRYGMSIAVGRGPAVIPFKSYEDSDDLKMRLYAVTA